MFNNLVAYAKAHMNNDVKLDYFAVSLPNLLIFDDDLNLRNKIHCLYILGLGFAGLGNVDESKKALKQVLQYDAMHFGAKTHKAWLSAQA